MLLGSDGRPLIIPPVAHTLRKEPKPAEETKVEALPKATFIPTRQLKRAYLRMVALRHINQHFGPEPRKVRRALGLTLAKNHRFKEEVRIATGAW